MSELRRLVNLMTLMTCAFLDGGGKPAVHSVVLIYQPGRKCGLGRGGGCGLGQRDVTVGVGFGSRNVWR